MYQLTAFQDFRYFSCTQLGIPLEQMVFRTGKFLNSHWCMGDLTLFETLTVGASACVTDITKLLLSPSLKQHRNPCSGPPAEYQDLSKCYDWPIKKAIVNLPMKIKQNLKCTFGNLLSPLGTQTIGSIPSCCLGNESHSSPEQTAGCTNV